MTKFLLKMLSTSTFITKSVVSHHGFEHVFFLLSLVFKIFNNTVATIFLPKKCCSTSIFFVNFWWLGDSILAPLGSLLAPWEGPWDHPGAPWGPDPETSKKSLFGTSFWGHLLTCFSLFFCMFLRCVFGRPPDDFFNDFELIWGSILDNFRLLV